MSWSIEAMQDQVIARLAPGSSLNLGIGLPTGIAERLPPALGVWVHSENGLLGVSGRPPRGQASPTCINAGKETVALQAGGSFFDSSLSFAMIRGGHMDTCVLGAMQVAANGDLANWSVPGRKVTGMGGAMDLATGAQRVVALMRHHDKAGQSKLLRRCTLPLTACAAVHEVVTPLGIFLPRGDHFAIEALAPEVRPEALGEAGLYRVAAGHPR